jgi:nucleoid DNA-binding protein
MSDALVRGEQVKVSSFGTFSVRSKTARVGRNPKTGEEVPISPAPCADLPALAPDEGPGRGRQPALTR